MTTAANVPTIKEDRILILDFGSQYSQLIARRVRDSGVFCEMFPYDIDTQRITDFGAKGVILSGGPESVHAENSPRINDAVFDLGVPVLGICYGMQAMAERFGGQVHASDIHEFGAATINIDGKSTLTDGIEDAAAKLNVWMSHGDKVVDAPQGFDIVASTPSSNTASLMRGLFSACTLSGPPDKIMPFAPKSVMRWVSISYGNISQNTPESRTRRAINWLYCEPKSRIKMRSSLIVGIAGVAAAVVINRCPSRKN